MYSDLGICDGILLWLVVEEPSFTVLCGTHGSTLVWYRRVRRAILSQVEPPQPLGAPGGYITPAAWNIPDTSKGGTYQKWRTSGPGGYIKLVAWGVPNALDWGKKLEEAHKRLWWIHNP